MDTWGPMSSYVGIPPYFALLTVSAESLDVGPPALEGIRGFAARMLGSEKRTVTVPTKDLKTVEVIRTPGFWRPRVYGVRFSSSHETVVFWLHERKASIARQRLLSALEEAGVTVTDDGVVGGFLGRR